jgi:hypothetical protein
MFDEPNLFGQQTAFPGHSGTVEDHDPDGSIPRHPALPGPIPVPSAAAGYESTGASPDGIGAYAQPLESGIPNVPTGYQTGVRHIGMGAGGGYGDPMGAQWGFIEPADTSPGSAVKSAGFTALFATAALGTGIAVGGAWGAGAGLMLAGAAANVYRAQKWWGSNDPGEKGEAVTSAVFGALGTAVGVYLAYKAFEARSGGDDE